MCYQEYDYFFAMWFQVEEAFEWQTKINSRRNVKKANIILYILNVMDSNKAREPCKFKFFLSLK